VKYPEAAEALRPFAKLHMKYLDKTPALSETALEKRLRVLKQLDPEKYKKIVGSIEE
jgi:inhibitor of KinA sporulation pathway (predicted exonuclease)